MQKFTAEIKKREGINGTYVEIPFDVEKIFGAKRVKVKASFDGVPYRGSIVRMNGIFLIGISQEIRKAIGKNPGDLVRVEIEKDDDEREIELPEDFKAALEENDIARKHFEKLSYSHQREYVQWILTAKKAETKAARIKQGILMLSEGKPLK